MGDEWVTGIMEFGADLRVRWRTVTASFLVMSVGASPMVFVAFALLMPAVSATFGWSRGTASAALAAFSLAGAAAVPITGYLIDRFGLFRILAAGIPMFAVTLMAVSTTSSQPLVFMAFYVALGIFGTCLGPLPYAKAVSSAFDRNRGVALGIAMAGNGIGSVFVPLITGALLFRFGWQSTYIFLGMLSALGGALALAMLRVEPQSRHALPVRTCATEPFEQKTFWLIAVGLFAASFALNGIIPHIGAIAEDRGSSTSRAAALVSLLGISSIVGRLATGWLLDRYHAKLLVFFIFLIPLAGVSLLLLVPGQTLLPLEVLSLGFGLGAEIDLMGYLVGRYFELRRYGSIYGWHMAFVTVGAAVGTLVMGIVWDRLGSYSTGLAIAIAALTLAMLLLSRLGAYTFPSAGKA